MPAQFGRRLPAQPCLRYGLHAQAVTSRGSLPFEISLVSGVRVGDMYSTGIHLGRLCLVGKIAVVWVLHLSMHVPLRRRIALFFERVSRCYANARHLADVGKHVSVDGVVYQRLRPHSNLLPASDAILSLDVKLLYFQ